MLSYLSPLLVFLAVFLPFFFCALFLKWLGGVMQRWSREQLELRGFTDEDHAPGRTPR